MLPVCVQDRSRRLVTEPRLCLEAGEWLPQKAVRDRMACVDGHLVDMSRLLEVNGVEETP